jgi:methyltransferase (TIGR00027 family)
MKRDRPSVTARKVALNILALGAKPEMQDILPDGIVDATARLLVAAGVVSEGAVRFARSRSAVAIYEAFDWMMPGQFEAFAHRKAFCERTVRDGIAEGAIQVLVLGAGYDTLGWRLAPEFPGVRFLEIDEPATGERKARGIADLGPRHNLHLIRADLASRTLVDVLAAVEDWDNAATSVVIAEGLTPYLAPDAVKDLFLQCGRSTGPGSRFAFTYIGARDDGRPDAGRWTGLLLWLLRASGEPWLWSIRPDALPAFLEEAGWSCSDAAQPDESQARGIEHYHVAFHSAHSGAGSDQLAEPDPVTSSLDPATTANDA